MAPDLEALVVAAYVFADEYPAPARPGPAVKISDPELVAPAMGSTGMPRRRRPFCGRRNGSRAGAELIAHVPLFGWACTPG